VRVADRGLRDGVRNLEVMVESESAECSRDKLPFSFIRGQDSRNIQTPTNIRATTYMTVHIMSLEPHTETDRHAR